MDEKPYSNEMVEKLHGVIHAKVESLRPRTRYENIRLPNNAKGPDCIGYECMWYYGFEVPGSMEDGKTSGALTIFLNKETGEFELTNGLKTHDITEVLDGIEAILLDERGKK